MITTQTYQIGDNVELMRKMPPETFDTIITSPPYWSLRDYGVDGQIGLEGTLEEYHTRLLEVTAECMRVLKPTGVMFWNHGDSYGGSWQNCGAREGKQRTKNTDCFERHGSPSGTCPPSAKMPGKCLTMQNERLIIRMIDDQGWILRNRIIWNKPNGMPSSVTDRFSNKYEPVYMLVKSKKYWFDLDAVRKPYTEPMNRWGGQKLKADGKSDWDKGTGQESYRDRDLRPNPLGKNPGDVWTIPTQPYPESHFATFPTALIEPMIKAACPAEICPVCGMGPKVTHHTTGWTSCDCGKPFTAGTVLDPFCGSGTVLEVCRLLNRNAIGLELNPKYEPLIKDRSMADTPSLDTYA